MFGLITLGIVLVEWTAQAWADKATGDPAANREIRNRLMNPIEVPAAGLLAVALVVVAFSRVFLTVSSENAVWVATGLAAVIFIVGVLVASRPKLSSNVVVGPRCWPPRCWSWSPACWPPPTASASSTSTARRPRAHEVEP